MTFLDTQTLEAIGNALGQKFTEGQLTELCDLLRFAGQACDYAAEDYAERADFERKHHGSEEADYMDASESFAAHRERLGQLIEEIEAGEQRYREDG